MSDIEAKNQASEIIKKLVVLPYSQIFDIAPLERDLSNIHEQNPNIAEALIGMMFCAIMQGNKQKAIELANKIWNIGVNVIDELEMLYTDCLINIGEFEKARILITNRMNDVEKNLNLFYNAVVKFAICTGELYILTNLAKYPEVYITEPPLFDFAEKYSDGINNKHYSAILKIINDTIGNFVCTTEYMIHDYGDIQLCLYTSLGNEENSKLQNIIFEKIKGYYISMQEVAKKNIFIRIENINLHPAWW